jgi:hypothetical protein
MKTDKQVMIDDPISAKELADLKEELKASEEKLPSVADMKPAVFESLDLSEFEGKRFKIEKLELKEMPSKFDPSGKQWCLRVLSEVVTTIPATTDEGNDIDIRCSELFNVLKNKDDISWSSKSNLAKFMKKMKVEYPKDLEGKSAVCRTYEKVCEGSTKMFLGFIKE